MGKNNKLAMPISLIAMLVIGVVVGGNLFATEIVPEAKSGTHIGGVISVEHIRPAINPATGEPQEAFHNTQAVHNVVTDFGLNWTRDALLGFGAPGAVRIDNNVNNWSVIALANVSGDVTDFSWNNSADYCLQEVTGNGLGRTIAGTAIRREVGNFTLSNTFTVTGTQTGINRVCISNSTAVGTAEAGLNFAMANISSTNVINGDNLIVNYSLAVENA